MANHYHYNFENIFWRFLQNCEYLQQLVMDHQTCLNNDQLPIALFERRFILAQVFSKQYSQTS